MLTALFIFSFITIKKTHKTQKTVGSNGIVLLQVDKDQYKQTYLTFSCPSS